MRVSGIIIHLWMLSGESNGTPLQYSCLENPMDGGDWKAAFHWGRWGSDSTERLHFHFSCSCIGEGHGNPLQCSCLENPRDGGAWWAAVYGVAQSRKRLKWLSSMNAKTQINKSKLAHLANCRVAYQSESPKFLSLTTSTLRGSLPPHNTSLVWEHIVLLLPLKLFLCYLLWGLVFSSLFLFMISASFPSGGKFMPVRRGLTRMFGPAGILSWVRKVY